MKPTPFSPEGYAAWHEAVVAADRPVVERLTALRERIMVDSRPDLEILSRLLTYMFTYTRREYNLARGQEATYHTPLLEALRTGPSGVPSPGYLDLFKPVRSIVEKMWRKAEAEPTVTLSNIQHSITDLIRTDVRTETLDGARFLADRMNHLPGLLYEEELKARYEERVESVSFEPEMKMASGYFAYHGLVRFRSGHVAEVQIYSTLMSEWRKLSHQLYERVRLQPVAKHEFASPEARLISLGHSLHLAECEIMRLRQEMEKS